MNDIVVLTVELDQPSGRALFTALSDAGLDVRRAVISESNQSATDASRIAGEARCVLLGWSRRSAASPRFIALARHAALRKVAIGIEFEPGAYRPGYGPMRLYSFAGGVKRSLRVRLGRRLYLHDILVAIRYKSAGEEPPPPTAPHKLLIRELGIGLGGAATLVGLLAAFPELYQALPWPRFKEREEWAKARTCDDLRDFREHFPNSDRAALASAILERARKSRIQQQRIDRSTDMMVPAGTTPASRDEGEARRVLASRAESEAAVKCEGFTGAVPDWRVLRSSVRPIETQCIRIGAGYVCRLVRAKALCTLEGPVKVETEECRVPH